jgi:hypothetical protein
VAVARRVRTGCMTASEGWKRETRTELIAR